tara:strand:+ start:1573 stop:1896 length:324 start_codon:yes stop_codon:yes gene_type:complete
MKDYKITSDASDRILVPLLVGALGVALVAIMPICRLRHWNEEMAREFTPIFSGDTTAWRYSIVPLWQWDSHADVIWLPWVHIPMVAAAVVVWCILVVRVARSSEASS